MIASNSETTNVTTTAVLDMGAPQAPIIQEQPPIKNKVKNFLTITETAEYLGVCVPTVRRYISNKELDVFKNHRVVRIPRVELEAFVRRQMNTERGENNE